VDLLEAGKFPLRTSVVGASRHGVPRESARRGADAVLYRVTLPGRPPAQP
jgi:hypothetical protein